MLFTSDLSKDILDIVDMPESWGRGMKYRGQVRRSSDMLMKEWVCELCPTIISDKDTFVHAGVE